MSDDEPHDPLQAVLEAWFEALDRGEPADTVHLAALCAGDRELLARATRALASEEGAARLLATLGPLAPEDRPPREAIGPYRLLRRLGRGGMGTVYLAEDPALPRYVALKVVDPRLLGEETALLRFRREAEITASLDDPHIVPVYAVGEDGGSLYIAMKCLSGPPLHELPGPLEPKEAARIGAAIARALGSAHRAGVVHRDVKPANVILDNDRPYVVDFGLARSTVDASVTQSGTMLGTLAYAAPEHLRGGSHGFDPRGDVFSLGATLYEIVAGRPCFDAEDPRRLARQLLEDDPAPLRLRGRDRDFETIVLRCLRKERDARFASMDDLAADLDRYRAGVPVLSRPQGIAERGLRLALRHPRASAILAIAFLAVLALGFLLSLRLERERAALRSALAFCEQALDRRDLPAAEGALVWLAAEHATAPAVLELRRYADGLAALDELLDLVQLPAEAQDLDHLRSIDRTVRDLEIERREPRLSLAAQAFAALQLEDRERAGQLAGRIESELGRDRTTAALRMLLADESSLGPDVLAARTADEHVFAFTALRFAGADVDVLRPEVDAALRLDPTNHRVQIAAARLLHEENEFAAARSAFRALERPGRRNDAMIRAAALESIILDDTNAALADLDRIPDAASTPVDAKNRLNALWQADRRDDFDVVLAAATTRWPNSPDVLLMRARREGARGEWRSAAATCEAVLEHATWFRHRDRARAERVRADFQLARPEAAPGGVSAPVSAEADVALRSIDDAARDTLDEIRDPPARSIVLTMRGKISEALGDPNRAVQMYRSATEAEPDDAVAHLSLAMLLYAEIHKQRLAEVKKQGEPSALHPGRSEVSEARRHAGAILAQRDAMKLPFSTGTLEAAAKIEAVFAKAEGDRDACGEAAEIALDCARRRGGPEPADMTALLEWARGARSRASGHDGESDGR